MSATLATEPIDETLPSDLMPVQTVDDVVHDFMLYVAGIIQSDPEAYKNNEAGFLSARDDFVQSMRRDKECPEMEVPLDNSVEDCFGSYQNRFVMAFIAAVEGAGDL